MLRVNNVSVYVVNKLSGLCLPERRGMTRTKRLKQTRLMRTEEVYEWWTVKRLTQEEAAQITGVCERTFGRYDYA